MPQERLPSSHTSIFTCESKRIGWTSTNTLEDYIENVGWNRLGLQPSEMLEVVTGRDVWRLNLERLPMQSFWT